MDEAGTVTEFLSLYNMYIDSSAELNPPGQVPVAGPILPSGARKCAINECPNPCFIDEAGTVHECCGITHAMEHQRRKAIEQRKTIVYVAHTSIVMVVILLPYICRTTGCEGRDALPITRMQQISMAIQELLWEITCGHWLSDGTGT